MKRSLTILLICTAFLSGCSILDDDDDDAPAPAPATVTTTAFDTLVVNMIENQTSDTAAAVAINALTITFSEEEGQFDGLLGN